MWLFNCPSTILGFPLDTIWYIKILLALFSLFVSQPACQIWGPFCRGRFDESFKINYLPTTSDFLRKQLSQLFFSDGEMSILASFLLFCFETKNFRTGKICLFAVGNNFFCKVWFLVFCSKQTVLVQGGRVGSGYIKYKCTFSKCQLNRILIVSCV